MTFGHLRTAVSPDGPDLSSVIAAVGWSNGSDHRWGCTGAAGDLIGGGS